MGGAMGGAVEGSRVVWVTRVGLWEGPWEGLGEGLEEGHRLPSSLLILTVNLGLHT